MASFFASLGSKYQQLMQTMPVRTQMGTAGLLCSAGDCLAQNIEKYLDVQSPGKAQYNFNRTARMWLYGTCIAGPAYHLWFTKLAQLTAGMSPTKQLVSKLCYDTFMFSPSFLVVYFGATGALEQRSPTEIKEKIQTSWWTAYQRVLFVWGPIQTINFKFIPVLHQALFVNVINIGWQTYLSILNHRKEYHTPAELAEQAELAERAEQKKVLASA